MEQPTQMKRFTPAGRVKADSLVRELIAHGIQAKIANTWLDYGQRTAWETITVYDQKIKMWYQSLTEADFATINAGGEPPGYLNDLKKKASTQTKQRIGA